MHDTGTGSGQSCWRKSSYSLTIGECVEVTSSSAGIKVRDSNKKESTVIFPALQTDRLLLADFRIFDSTVLPQHCVLAYVSLTKAITTP